MLKLKKAISIEFRIEYQNRIRGKTGLGRDRDIMGGWEGWFFFSTACLDNVIIM